MNIENIIEYNLSNLNKLKDEKNINFKIVTDKRFIKTLLISGGITKNRYGSLAGIIDGIKVQVKIDDRPVTDYFLK